MFKKLLIGLSALSIGCTAFASSSESAYIISGFDDVLRQAENTSLWKAALKILEPDTTFTGMAEIYQVVSEGQPVPEFSLVSATSTLFAQRFNELLNKSGYPTRKVYFRNWLTERSIEDFKISRIQTIMKEYPERKFIVIFDNSDPSLAMAETLRAMSMNRIEAIYLHQVIEKTTPKSAIPFFTAFDIALNEYRSGRLSIAGVQTVADAILKENRTANIFPAYALCPRNYNPCLTADGEATKICELVRAHTIDLCRHR